MESIDTKRRAAGEELADLTVYRYSFPESALNERMQVILAEHGRRWEANDPMSIDSLLQQLPWIATDRSLLLSLVIAEFQQQSKTNNKPSWHDFVLRFPTIADTLREELGKLTKDVDERIASSFTQTFKWDDNHEVVLQNRYRLIKLIGRGAFGVVYQALDNDLKRHVAIKVPNRELFLRPQDAEMYLNEARTVAALEHPHIVPVYDMGRTHENVVFVVSRYVAGGTLESQLQHYHDDFRATADLIKVLADALQHAHDRRLIHRDIKPANILIEDESKKPYITDFGLAVLQDDYAQQSGLSGTMAYMSPEQARGEGHRLDGRSDIFALGTVLYELLTAQRPFRGATQDEVLHQVISIDPVLPRTIREEIPVELERICLKALNKQLLDRYRKCSDLAEDLEVWLQAKVESQHLDQQELAVTPRGLRSFDAGDAGFFLSLLPGQRSRDGLPESIAFWKRRIEQRNADHTFAVGIIYGPSGCGKSSLVKAGLIPNLDQSIVTIYIEATTDDTESRILLPLQKAFPELASIEDLSNAIAVLRRHLSASPKQKILIIIDQLEQWLHTHQAEATTELVKALRQCDGANLQAIVMIRDDFAMAADRLMKALDIPILQGDNFATVDLFDLGHASRVLTKFGQAFGKLPVRIDMLNSDQRRFVRDVVEGLADDGRVIPVRLSLFSEMVKDKPWTMQTLKSVGGTAGIGVNFLEETFASQRATPRHRFHCVAARGVLSALMPEIGTDIKGHMRSKAELMAAAGYQDRPQDFNELLQILDGELRLVTPTDPKGHGSHSERACDDQHFQLTHDYLVPALREWLTRKQRETQKGRAELKLEERAVFWNTKHENKQLPSSLEWLQIRWHTQRSKWTEPQRKMMQTAVKVHGLKWGGALAVLLAIGGIAQYWVSQWDWSNKREQTRIAAESLQNNLGSSIPMNIGELKKLPEPLVLGELANRFSTDNSSHKLAMAFALAAYGQVEIEYLVSRIDDIASFDTANFVEALALDLEKALATLRTEADKCNSKSLWRRKAKLAIAALALGKTEIAADMCHYESRTDHSQRTNFIHEFPHWEWHLPNRKISLQQLSRSVAESKDSGLRSGIILAVGSIPLDRLQDLNPTALESWIQLGTRWFAEHYDTSTHGAASWLLRQWKLPLPEVVDQNKVLPDRDWFVNSAETTMLRVREPVVVPIPETSIDVPQKIFPRQLVEQRELTKEKLPGKLYQSQGESALPKSEYWIASCEVTRGQFEAFMQDDDYQFEKPTDWGGVDTDISPTAMHPAQKVSWYDAVMYCNWLSRREGKSPVYQKTAKKKFEINDGENELWELEPNADGYRLLSQAEWIFAARSGSTTDWAVGTDEQFLVDYCQMNPSKLSAVVGHKLPNPWGLQDMHGNVWEWFSECDPMDSNRRLDGGGCWFSIVEHCRTIYISSHEPNNRSRGGGFRVALCSPSGQSPEVDTEDGAELECGGTEGAK